MTASRVICGLVLSYLMATSASATEIISHRGCSAHAPENTVSALKLAWESGADACELDVHLTRDGHIVVIHDKDTARTAGGTKLIVKDSSLADLRALDVGEWKSPKWQGERIPTLAECLATLPATKGRIFIEIKSGPSIVPALAQQLAPFQPRAHQLVIISFDEQAAAQSKAAMPWCQVYLLQSGKERQTGLKHDISKAIFTAKKHQLDGLNLGTDWDWNAHLVKAVRTAGLGLYVWTVNNPDLARKLAALGVDGITTDDPALIRQALSEAPPTGEKKAP